MSSVKSGSRLTWHHFLLAGVISFAPFILSAATYLHVYKTNFLTIRQEMLLNSAQHLLNMTRQKFDLVINLQNQAETALRHELDETADGFVRMSQEITSVNGRLGGDATTRQLFMELLSSVKPRHAGYGFIVDRNGFLVQHPMLPERFDLTGYRFIKEMMRQENGSLQYWWKNPGESDPVERVMAYRTVIPWNWIVCIEAPIGSAADRSLESHHWQGYYDYVATSAFPWQGYAMVLENNGDLVVHPAHASGTFRDIPGGQIIMDTQERICEFRDDMNRTWWAAVVRFRPKKWVLAVTAMETDLLDRCLRHRKYVWISVGLAGAVLFSLILIWLQFMIRPESSESDPPHH